MIRPSIKISSIGVIRAIRRIAPFLLGLVAALCLAEFRKHPLLATLDSSWSAVLSYAAVKHLQFGREIIFSYGPLGHLVQASYSSKLFLPQLAANIAISASYVAMLFVLSRRLGPTRGWCFIIGAFLGALFSWQTMFQFLLVTSGWLAFGVLRPNRFLLIPALAFVAVAALIKATLLFFALLIVSCGLVNLLLRRDVRRAVLTSVLFTGFFLTAWCLAGQEISNIPSYVASSFEILRGYSSAMSLPPRPIILAAGVIGFVLAGIQIAIAFVRHRAEPGAWFISVLLLAALFLAWKLGFSRADTHTLDFFYYAIVAVLALPVFLSRPSAGKARVFDWMLILIVVACGLFAVRDQTADSVATIYPYLRDRLIRNIDILRHPGAVSREYAESLRRDAQALELPQIKEVVGQASVDVFGVEQAVAIANDLNFTPRPIFQTQMVYTPALVRINSRFYTSSRAPEYVILKLTPVDSHIPALEDSEVFLLLARHYRPVLTEHGYSLLKRETKAVTSLSDQKKPGPAGQCLIDRPMFVPTGTIWCELKIHKTLLGTLIGFLYQLPEVWIEFGSEAKPAVRQRIVPVLAAHGFLINPLLPNDHDFLEFARGNSEGGQVQTATVRSSRDLSWLIKPQIDYRFSEIAILPPEGNAISQ
jgi:hypothetical protein